MKIAIDIDCTHERCNGCELQSEAFGSCTFFAPIDAADWTLHLEGNRLSRCVDAGLEEAEREAERDAARVVLRGLEWLTEEYTRNCPWCGRPEIKGHADDCALAAALGDA